MNLNLKLKTRKIRLWMARWMLNPTQKMKKLGSYDYLLHIRTVDYTEERVKALMDETDKLGKELRLLEATSCFDMWKNDIKNM